MSPPREATDASFEHDVLERSEELPVVVDFWADWCAPCRALAPVLEQAVAELGGAVELVKLDVDANQEVARRFEVRGIPAVKAFRRGQVVGEFVGAIPPQRVEEFLAELTRPPAAERLLETDDLDPAVRAALERNDVEGALELLLARVPAAGPDERARIREAMVALFADLGPDHPTTVSYRRRLATALY